MQGYHFPPSEGQPAYGYSNPQLLAPQQWPQHGDPGAHEINYQGYGDTDPGPFQHGAHVQHRGYTDSDAEFGDGYYEDEEPRRGKRWLLIAVALVGAIGVGGALAYTYRSLVAPKSRLVAPKSEPVKVKVGRDLSSAEQPPVKVAEESASPKTSEPAAQEDPPPGGGDGQGPRTVKTITFGPGGGPPPSSVAPPVSIPGITLYKPPEAQAPPAPSAKEKTKEAQPPPGRVTIGTPPPAPPPAAKEKEEEEDPPTPVTPPVKKSQTALATPKLPAPPKAKESGSGLGFVAVIKSEKTSMDAMKAYADLQQRYPEVLGDKSFDVQEADLSARGLGVMYRVVVGPPGSHNAASGVCAQLKAAGYVGCWVKEY
jgi:cytoskeletal protein RodZ